nr:type II secretion system protein [uncultured Eisenbergiella sp.]
MGIWKKLRNKKGYTLIELIVTFVLIGIFMVSATAVMSSFMHVFARVKSISTAQNVADILLTKATGEIADGQGRKFTPLEESAADEEKKYALYIRQHQDPDGSRHDSAVFLNEEGIQVSVGMLGDILPETERAGLDESGIMDEMLLLRYCTKTVDPETGTTAADSIEYTNWYYGKPSYMGTQLTELKIEKVEEDKNIIRITVTLENSKTHYSPQTISRVVKCRNMDAGDINVVKNEY